MKRLISWLYNKYCRVQLDTLYLNGLQRGFTKELTDVEVKERNLNSFEFVNSGASDNIFTEILKSYSEALFSLGQDEKTRDILHNNINVVLKVEDVIKGYAQKETKSEDFDPNNPL
jgi:hypothetical protein